MHHCFLCFWDLLEVGVGVSYTKDEVGVRYPGRVMDTEEERNCTKKVCGRRFPVILFFSFQCWAPRLLLPLPRPSSSTSSSSLPFSRSASSFHSSLSYQSSPSLISPTCASAFDQR